MSVVFLQMSVLTLRMSCPNRASTVFLLLWWSLMKSLDPILMDIMAHQNDAKLLSTRVWSNLCNGIIEYPSIPLVLHWCLTWTQPFIGHSSEIYWWFDNPDDLQENWWWVLEAFKDNGVRLSPHKTVIAPTYSTVLGWHWQQDTMQSSKHCVVTLTTC